MVAHKDVGVDVAVCFDAVVFEQIEEAVPFLVVVENSTPVMAALSQVQAGA